MQGHEDGYVILELLPDINFSSNKGTPVPSVIVGNTVTNDENNAMVDHDEDVEIHLLLNSQWQVNM